MTRKATSQRLSLAITSDQARIINLWHKATTLEEKNAIEDTYFPNNKIRQTAEDVISIVGYMKIYTNGKSLEEGTWELLPDNSLDEYESGFTVKQLEENLYQIENIGSSNHTKIVQTTQLVDKTNEYIINSKIENSLNVPFYYYDSVSFSTTQPVKLTPPSSPNFLWWDLPYCTTSGELNIKVYKNKKELTNDQTSAFFDTDETIITFRNHNEFYQKLYLEFVPAL